MSTNTSVNQSQIQASEQIDKNSKQNLTQGGDS